MPCDKNIVTWLVSLSIVQVLSIFLTCGWGLEGRSLGEKEQAMMYNDRGAFFLLGGGGGGGLTSGLKWGALETLLLKSVYFFGNIGGGGAKSPLLRSP